MAPIRTMTARRSRRLSSQVPVQYDEEGWEATDLLMHLTTPVSDAPSPTPSAFSHSSTQSDTPSPRQHTPLYRRTPGHVGRPPNAFMLFRSDYWRENKDVIRERDHREISRICGQLWRALPPDEKQVYRDMANDVKEVHLAKYPDYKFTRVSRQKKTRKIVSRDRDIIEEAGKCDKIKMLTGEGILVLEMNDMCATPSPSATDEETSQFSQLLTSGCQGHFICGEENAFVPTCDIPPLDLDCSQPRNEHSSPTTPQLRPY
ncbi:high mobility group box domain-containing protein [Armillaria mellea]|nr:high mobility group box domain-containing protein [Armillaria mellea]